MNMRQHKRAVYARAYHYPLVLFRQDQAHARFMATMHSEAAHVIDHIAQGPSDLVQAFREGMAQATDPAPYYCLKVKDDSIVGEFATREEALALVNKHIKGKKAKLHVTHKGEPVLFSEEEFA